VVRHATQVEQNELTRRGRGRSAGVHSEQRDACGREAGEVSPTSPTEHARCEKSQAPAKGEVIFSFVPGGGDVNLLFPITVGAR
jgi:hypothetical protein